MDKIEKQQFENKAVLTAKALIEKRALIEKKKQGNVLIEVTGLGTFEFRIPDFYDIEDSNANEDSDQYLIYACCTSPNLKDKELQEAYNVSNPMDIVHAVFMPGEEAAISRILVEKAGYGAEAAKVIDKVKNESTRGMESLA